MELYVVTVDDKFLTSKKDVNSDKLARARLFKKAGSARKHVVTAEGVVSEVRALHIEVGPAVTWKEKVAKSEAEPKAQEEAPVVA